MSDINPLSATDSVVTLTADDFDKLKENREETRHTVSESADKIVLKADVKRGTGTRDQDKINVKVKGDDPEGTAERLAQTLAALEAEGVAQTLRGTQPETDE